MTLQNGSRIATVLRAAAPPAIIMLVAAVLLLLPPAQHSFYPRCPIYELFHLKCPGCGGTRALAALLHGNLFEALHWNALTTLLLPIAAAYGIYYYSKFLKHELARCPHRPLAAIYSAFGIAAAVFAIVRNLPHAAF
jgi:Protein of unknown function (DUF2752)